MKKPKDLNQSKAPKNLANLWWILIAISTVVLIGLLGALPENRYAQAAAASVLLLSLILLLVENRKSLKTRTAAFGFHSVMTTLIVIAIIGVLNFLGVKYPKKLDLTKNSAFTLSDQSVKAAKALPAPVKAVFFGKVPAQEKLRPLLRNYKEANPKFDFEFSDPDRDLTRFRSAGLTRLDSMILTMGEKTSKLDEVNEEKLTNALIKLGKEKKRILCTVTGHGEKSFKETTGLGYDAVKKELEMQYYDFKELPLAQEGKIPEDCDAVAILGPNRSPVEGEIKLIDDYAANGGRLLVALDIDIDHGGEESQGALQAVLGKWNLRMKPALVLDLSSKMLGIGPEIPIIPTFSKDHVITKDFKDPGFALMPIVRPIEIVEGAPASLNISWLAKSTPKSFGETSLKNLKSAGAKFDPGVDLQGPFNVAVAVEGKQKDSKATKSTRLIAFGSSLFGANQFVRTALNKDLILNSISWLMEDESLISIRGRESEPAKFDLTQAQGWVIFVVTVIAVPLSIAIFGIVNWIRRKKR